MAKQVVRTTRRTIRKSQTTVDKKGRRHCGYCGAYVGNKGKKKNNESNMTFFREGKDNSLSFFCGKM